MCAQASFHGLTYDIATDPMEDVLSREGKIICILTAITSGNS